MIDNNTSGTPLAANPDGMDQLETRMAYAGDLSALVNMSSIAEELVHVMIENSDDEGEIRNIRLTKGELGRLSYAVVETAVKAAAFKERWSDSFPPVSEPAIAPAPFRSVERIGSDFAAAFDAMTSHQQMSQMYETLAHLSDTVSALQCRPWFDTASESDDALQSLDNFLMAQIDAIRERAFTVQPTSRLEREARALLLIKYATRTRLNEEDAFDIVDSLRSEKVPV